MVRCSSSRLTLTRLLSRSIGERASFNEVSTAVKYAEVPIKMSLAPKVIMVASDAHSKGTNATKFLRCWRKKLTKRSEA